MRSLSFASVLLLALQASANAQEPPDPKTAAERLLAQDVIRMQFVSGGGRSSTYQTDLRTRRTQFPGSNDPVCFGGAVPTDVTYADGQLVLEFKPPLSGCTPVQYRFDPVTGDGKVLVSQDGRATWVPTPSGASVRLAR